MLNNVVFDVRIRSNYARDKTRYTEHSKMCGGKHHFNNAKANSILFFDPNLHTLLVPYFLRLSELMQCCDFFP